MLPTIVLNKTIDMKGESICLNCSQMNPENGYCPRVGEYVNAFWSCYQFYAPEKPEEIERKPRKPFVSPKKGTHPTAGRLEKRCSGCGKVKPIDQFFRLKRTSDGHGCYCLECNRLRTKRAREKKRNADNNRNQ